MQSADTIRVFDDIKQVTLEFTIFSFVNPPNTKQTDTFEFRAFDYAGNLIAHSLSQDPTVYSATPGPTRDAAVTRPIATVG